MTAVIAGLLKLAVACFSILLLHRPCVPGVSGAFQCDLARLRLGRKEADPEPESGADREACAYRLQAEYMVWRVEQGLELSRDERKRREAFLLDLFGNDPLPEK